MFKQLVIGAKTIIIAQELGISPRTVEKHRARVMKKLGARNHAELVRIALSDPEFILGNTHFRLWHKAEVGGPIDHGRCWGLSGRRFGLLGRRLLTKSGHRTRAYLAATNQ